MPQIEIISILTSRFFSCRSMTWTDKEDVLLLREIAAEGVFSHKYLSRERGSSWQKVAENLNACTEGNFNFLSSRSVRDHYTTLLKKYKAKKSKELRESGGGGDEPSEVDCLLEDLSSMAEDTERDKQQKKDGISKEKKMAEDIRKTALERMGETRKRMQAAAGCSDDEDENTPTKPVKSRRSSTDTIEWLKEKSANDARMREEELKFKKEELDLAKEQQNLQVKQSQNQMTLLMKQIEKQQEQQQQQQQQQMMMQQQMFAFMQSMLQKKD